MKNNHVPMRRFSAQHRRDQPDCLRPLLPKPLQPTQRPHILQNINFPLEPVPKRMPAIRERVVEQTPQRKNIYQLRQPRGLATAAPTAAVGGRTDAAPARRLRIVTSRIIQLHFSTQYLRCAPTHGPSRHSALRRRQKTRLVHVQLLTQPKIRYQHPMSRVSPAHSRPTPVLFGPRYEDILGFDIAVDYLQRMQVSQPGRDLPQRPFGVEPVGDIFMLVRALYDVCQGSRAELEGDVEEVGVGFLVVVSDDVGVVVGLLEDADFARGEGDEVLQEAFDGDGAALEGASEYDRPVGPKACPSRQRKKE